MVEKQCKPTDSKYTDKDYIELLQKLLDERKEAQQEAIKLVEKSTTARINSEQAAKFVAIADYKEYKVQIEDDIEELQKAKNIAQGKASQTSVIIAYVIIALQFVWSVITFFIK